MLITAIILILIVYGFGIYIFETESLDKRRNPIYRYFDVEEQATMAKKEWREMEIVVSRKALLWPLYLAFKFLKGLVYILNEFIATFFMALKIDYKNTKLYKFITNMLE